MAEARGVKVSDYLLGTWKNYGLTTQHIHKIVLSLFHSAEQCL